MEKYTITEEQIKEMAGGIFTAGLLTSAIARLMPDSQAEGVLTKALEAAKDTCLDRVKTWNSKGDSGGK